MHVPTITANYLAILALIDALALQDQAIATTELLQTPSYYFDTVKI